MGRWVRGPFQDPEGGRKPCGLCSSLPGTPLLQAAHATSHLGSRTTTRRWGRDNHFGHLALDRRGKSSGLRVSPSDPGLPGVPEATRFPTQAPDSLSGKCVVLVQWPLRFLHYAQSRPQQPVPTMSRGRGIHLPVTSQVCLPTSCAKGRASVYHSKHLFSHLQ